MSEGAIDAPPSAPIAVISGPSPHPAPDCEMDALLLGRTRELVASSPGQRNWRGIFIALLVIAAVLGLIVFSIFLLSPEDEGSRIRGRRIVLSDLSKSSLKWKPFNGTWINDVELVYRDPTGGLSILNFKNLTRRVLMTNSTFRELNPEKFLVSPDVNYVWLSNDHKLGTSRYYIYDVQATNYFPLAPQQFVGVDPPPRLQSVLWAPIPISKSSSQTDSMGGTVGNGMTNLNNSNSKYLSQGIAFVHENDLYYKPDMQTDLVCRITTTGKKGLVYNAIPNWMYSNIKELKSPTLAFSPDRQYLSFLTFNDTQVEEYKYTWVSDSTYPSVKSIRYPKANTTNPTVTVSVANLSVLKYVQPYVQPLRLPKSIKNGSYVGGMVWVSNIDLSITFTDREQNNAITILCRAPNFNCREIYTERVVENGWVIPAEVPIFSKTQTKFKYTSNLSVGNLMIQNESTSNLNNNDNIDSSNNNTKSNIVSSSTQNGNTINDSNNVNNLKNSNNNKNSSHNYSDGSSNSNSDTFISIENQSKSNITESEYEFKAGGYLLKRLPVRDGEHGHYRHIVFISPSDNRTVSITMGRFEVTEILGWDEKHQIIYFMAAPEQKPGQRHLYKVNLKLNATEKSTRIIVTSPPPICLTCDNSCPTFKIPHNISDPKTPWDDEYNCDNVNFYIPNNCLFNKIYFSTDFSYYVQECLGPDTPSIYVVNTKTNQKMFILHQGLALRNRLYELATPQIRIFNVEIRHGYQAQVRLFLPPGMKEEEEIAFPLILHVDASPGSQLVSEKYSFDWNWYLCSQNSMIVAQIDARGSGYQGEMMRAQVKGRLGTVEIEDQLGVLTYLRDNLKFVDPKRICAYGWGYGGYAVTMILSEDSAEVIQCAIAINPIVSYLYHNSFFTERYIPKNDDYSRAIQDSDLAIRAGNLDGRNYLLIHGTADEHVHSQHSLILAKALIDQAVGFRHQVYTNEDHKLSGVKHHLYKTMENYFNESFRSFETNEWDPTGFFAFKQ